MKKTEKNYVKDNNAFSLSLKSIFWNKDAYKNVATQFYPCHQHELNLLLHMIGASIQMWGAVQFCILFGMHLIVYLFITFVAITTPFATALFHTIIFGWFITVPLPYFTTTPTLRLIGCMLAFSCGFLKDVGHHICNEKAFMGSYMKDKPYLFFFHAAWHIPFLIDAYSPFSTVATKINVK